MARDPQRDDRREVIVEPAAEADLDAIIEIERHSFKQPRSRDSYRDELARPHATLSVARATGTIVGFTLVWLVADEAELLVIATHPDARRRGIGAALLTAALAQVRTARVMHLEVRAGNLAAQALYEKLGFAQVGRRRGYYADDGEDAVLMTATLSG